MIDLAEQPGERFEQLKAARIRLDRQDVRAGPLEQVAMQPARRLGENGRRRAGVAGVAHEPVRRPVKDHSGRGALMRMQRQPEQRREPHPRDQEAICISAAGPAAAERDRNMSSAHCAPPAPGGGLLSCHAA